ncbi:MAG: polysaccharide deacetylase family protein [Treponema sp.]|nr:polysaccharide deacetylase family protein [Treponema sp.]
MKKILSVIVFSLCLIMPAAAKISFGAFDLNSNDQVLFTLKQNMSGTSSYSSLFYSKLADGESTQSPELLTCYPEQMELLEEGTVLQLRNRYGNGRYNTKTDSFEWYERTAGIPVNSLPVSPYSISSDGKWLVKIEKYSLSTGSLVIQNIQTGKSAVLCESVRQSYKNLPVKWSPDGSILIYEKEGSVYFCNPEAVLRKVEMDEKYRKIGRGSINAVNWASEKNLIYIDDYLVYQINAKELYTLGLYSGVIGQGKAIGRLPSQFNSASDRFSVNSSANSFVIVQNNRLFTYLKIQNQKHSCDYMDVIYSRPYTDSSASLIDYYIFWDASDQPVLWLEKLPYDGSREKGAVYKLGSRTIQVLEIEDSGRPFISPDKNRVAFYAGAAIYVYDINTWQRVAELLGEKIVSAIWLNRNVMFVGGEKTIRRWNLLSNTSEVTMLSSAIAGYWEGTDGTIVADTGSQNYYRYNSEKHTWKKTSIANADAKSQNGRYRIFAGTTANKQYENALYIRTLTKKAVTKPLYKESTQKTAEPKKIALVFDAYDNADGLSEILSVLRKYNVQGTFFINGEFIRRYPAETRQIVLNGYQTGSMFFSMTDLVNNPFVVDEEFIRRGLARNEDEFYNCTGRELSLYWHGPYYSVNNDIIKYSATAGYSTIVSYSRLNDSELLDKDTKPEQIIQDYCSTLAKTGGGVVPVSVGFARQTRTEPLYNYLDLLICALLDSGFEFVDIQEL